MFVTSPLNKLPWPLREILLLTFFVSNIRAIMFSFIIIFFLERNLSLLEQY
jgi:hypothetical protein